MKIILMFLLLCAISAINARSSLPMTLEDIEGDTYSKLAPLTNAQISRKEKILVKRFIPILTDPNALDLSFSSILGKFTTAVDFMGFDTSGLQLLQKLYNSAFARSHLLFKRKVLNLIMQTCNFILKYLPEESVQKNPQLYQLNGMDDVEDLEEDTNILMNENLNELDVDETLNRNLLKNGLGSKQIINQLLQFGQIEDSDYSEGSNSNPTFGVPNTKVLYSKVPKRITNLIHFATQKPFSSMPSTEAITEPTMTDSSVYYLKVTKNVKEDNEGDLINNKIVKRWLENKQIISNHQVVEETTNSNNRYKYISDEDINNNHGNDYYDFLQDDSDATQNFKTDGDVDDQYLFQAAREDYYYPRVRRNAEVQKEVGNVGVAQEQRNKPYEEYEVSYYHLNDEEMDEAENKENPANEIESSGTNSKYDNARINGIKAERQAKSNGSQNNNPDVELNIILGGDQNLSMKTSDSSLKHTTDEDDETVENLPNKTLSISNATNYTDGSDPRNKNQLKTSNVSDDTKQAKNEAKKFETSHIMKIPNKLKLDDKTQKSKSGKVNYTSEEKRTFTSNDMNKGTDNNIYEGNNSRKEITLFPSVSSEEYSNEDIDGSQSAESLKNTSDDYDESIENQISNVPPNETLSISKVTDHADILEPRNENQLKTSKVREDSKLVKNDRKKFETSHIMKIPKKLKLDDNTQKPESGKENNISEERRTYPSNDINKGNYNNISEVTDSSKEIITFFPSVSSDEYSSEEINGSQSEESLQMKYKVREETISRYGTDPLGESRVEEKAYLTNMISDESLKNTGDEYEETSVNHTTNVKPIETPGISNATNHIDVSESRNKIKLKDSNVSEAKNEQKNRNTKSETSHIMKIPKKLKTKMGVTKSESMEKTGKETGDTTKGANKNNSSKEIIKLIPSVPSEEYISEEIDGSQSEESLKIKYKFGEERGSRYGTDPLGKIRGKENETKEIENTNNDEAENNSSEGDSTVDVTSVQMEYLEDENFSSKLTHEASTGFLLSMRMKDGPIFNLENIENNKVHISKRSAEEIDPIIINNRKHLTVLNENNSKHIKNSEDNQNNFKSDEEVIDKNDKGAKSGIEKLIFKEFDKSQNIITSTPTPFSFDVTSKVLYVKDRSNATTTEKSTAAEINKNNGGVENLSSTEDTLFTAGIYHTASLKEEALNKTILNHFIEVMDEERNTTENIEKIIIENYSNKALNSTDQEEMDKPTRFIEQKEDNITSYKDIDTIFSGIGQKLLNEHNKTKIAEEFNLNSNPEKNNNETFSLLEEELNYKRNGNQKSETLISKDKNITIREQLNMVPPEQTKGETLIATQKHLFDIENEEEKRVEKHEQVEDISGKNEKKAEDNSESIYTSTILEVTTDYIAEIPEDPKAAEAHFEELHKNLEILKEENNLTREEMPSTTENVQNFPEGNEQKAKMTKKIDEHLLQNQRNDTFTKISKSDIQKVQGKEEPNIAIESLRITEKIFLDDKNFNVLNRTENLAKTGNEGIQKIQPKYEFITEKTMMMPGKEGDHNPEVASKGTNLNVTPSNTGSKKNSEDHIELIPKKQMEASDSQIVEDSEKTNKESYIEIIPQKPVQTNGSPNKAQETEFSKLHKMFENLEESMAESGDLSKQNSKNVEELNSQISELFAAVDKVMSVKYETQEANVKKIIVGDSEAEYEALLEDIFTGDNRRENNKNGKVRNAASKIEENMKKIKNLSDGNKTNKNFKVESSNQQKQQQNSEEVSSDENSDPDEIFLDDLYSENGNQIVLAYNEDDKLNRKELDPEDSNEEINNANNKDTSTMRVYDNTKDENKIQIMDDNVDDDLKNAVDIYENISEQLISRVEKKLKKENAINETDISISEQNQDDDDAILDRISDELKNRLISLKDENDSLSQKIANILKTAQNDYIEAITVTSNLKSRQVQENYKIKRQSLNESEEQVGRIYIEKTDSNDYKSMPFIENFIDLSNNEEDTVTTRRYHVTPNPLFEGETKIALIKKEDYTTAFNDEYEDATKENNPVSNRNKDIATITPELAVMKEVQENSSTLVTELNTVVTEGTTPKTNFSALKDNIQFDATEALQETVSPLITEINTVLSEEATSKTDSPSLKDEINFDATEALQENFSLSVAELNTVVLEETTSETDSSTIKGDINFDATEEFWTSTLKDDTEITEDSVTTSGKEYIEKSNDEVTTPRVGKHSPNFEISSTSTENSNPELQVTRTKFEDSDLMKTAFHDFMKTADLPNNTLFSTKKRVEEHINFGNTSIVLIYPEGYDVEDVEKIIHNMKGDSGINREDGEFFKDALLITVTGNKDTSGSIENPRVLRFKEEYDSDRKYKQEDGKLDDKTYFDPQSNGGQKKLVSLKTDERNETSVRKRKRSNNGHPDTTENTKSLNFQNDKSSFTNKKKFQNITELMKNVITNVNRVGQFAVTDFKNKTKKYVQVVVHKSLIFKNNAKKVKYNDQIAQNRRKRQLSTGMFSGAIHRFRQMSPSFQGFSNIQSQKFQIPIPQYNEENIFYGQGRFHHLNTPIYKNHHSSSIQNSNYSENQVHSSSNEKSKFFGNEFKKGTNLKNEFEISEFSFLPHYERKTEFQSAIKPSTFENQQKATSTSGNPDGIIYIFKSLPHYKQEIGFKTGADLEFQPSTQEPSFVKGYDKNEEYYNGLKNWIHLQNFKNSEDQQFQPSTQRAWFTKIDHSTSNSVGRDNNLYPSSGNEESASSLIGTDSTFTSDETVGTEPYPPPEIQSIKVANIDETPTFVDTFAPVKLSHIQTNNFYTGFRGHESAPLYPREGLEKVSSKFGGVAATPLESDLYPAEINSAVDEATETRKTFEKTSSSKIATETTNKIEVPDISKLSQFSSEHLPTGSNTKITKQDNPNTLQPSSVPSNFEKQDTHFSTENTVMDITEHETFKFLPHYVRKYDFKSKFAFPKFVFEPKPFTTNQQNFKETLVGRTKQISPFPGDLDLTEHHIKSHRIKNLQHNYKFEENNFDHPKNVYTFPSDLDLPKYHIYSDKISNYQENLDLENRANLYGNVGKTSYLEDFDASYTPPHLKQKSNFLANFQNGAIERNEFNTVQSAKFVQKNVNNMPQNFGQNIEWQERIKNQFEEYKKQALLEANQNIIGQNIDKNINPDSSAQRFNDKFGKNEIPKIYASELKDSQDSIQKQFEEYKKQALLEAEKLQLEKILEQNINQYGAQQHIFGNTPIFIDSRTSDFDKQPPTISQAPYNKFRPTTEGTLDTFLDTKKTTNHNFLDAKQTKNPWEQPPGINKYFLTENLNQKNIQETNKEHENSKIKDNLCGPNHNHPKFEAVNVKNLFKQQNFESKYKSKLLNLDKFANDNTKVKTHLDQTFNPNVLSEESLPATKTFGNFQPIISSDTNEYENPKVIAFDPMFLKELKLKLEESKNRILSEISIKSQITTNPPFNISTTGDTEEQRSLMEEENEDKEGETNKQHQHPKIENKKSAIKNEEDRIKIENTNEFVHYKIKLLENEDTAPKFSISSRFKEDEKEEQDPTYIFYDIVLDPNSANDIFPETDIDKNQEKDENPDDDNTVHQVVSVSDQLVYKVEKGEEKKLLKSSPPGFKEVKNEENRGFLGPLQAHVTADISTETKDKTLEVNKGEYQHFIGSLQKNEIPTVTNAILVHDISTVINPEIIKEEKLEDQEKNDDTNKLKPGGPIYFRGNTKFMSTGFEVFPKQEDLENVNLVAIEKNNVHDPNPNQNKFLEIAPISTHTANNEYKEIENSSSKTGHQFLEELSPPKIFVNGDGEAATKHTQEEILEGTDLISEPKPGKLEAVHYLINLGPEDQNKNSLIPKTVLAGILEGTDVVPIPELGRVEGVHYVINFGNEEKGETLKGEQDGMVNRPDGINENYNFPASSLTRLEDIFNKEIEPDFVPNKEGEYNKAKFENSKPNIIEGIDIVEESELRKPEGVHYLPDVENAMTKKTNNEDLNILEGIDMVGQLEEGQPEAVHYLIKLGSVYEETDTVPNSSKEISDSKTTLQNENIDISEVTESGLRRSEGVYYKYLSKNEDGSSRIPDLIDESETLPEPSSSEEITDLQLKVENPEILEGTDLVLESGMRRPEGIHYKINLGRNNGDINKNIPARIVEIDDANILEGTDVIIQSEGRRIEDVHYKINFGDDSEQTLASNVMEGSDTILQPGMRRAEGVHYKINLGSSIDELYLKNTEKESQNVVETESASRKHDEITDQEETKKPLKSTLTFALPVQETERQTSRDNLTNDIIDDNNGSLIFSSSEEIDNRGDNDIQGVGIIQETNHEDGSNKLSTESLGVDITQETNYKDIGGDILGPKFRAQIFNEFNLPSEALSNVKEQNLPADIFNRNSFIPTDVNGIAPSNFEADDGKVSTVIDENGMVLTSFDQKHNTMKIKFSNRGDVFDYSESEEAVPILTQRILTIPEYNRSKVMLTSPDISFGLNEVQSLNSEKIIGGEIIHYPNPGHVTNKIGKSAGPEGDSIGDVISLSNDKNNFGRGEIVYKFELDEKNEDLKADDPVIDQSSKDGLNLIKNYIFSKVKGGQQHSENEDEINGLDMIDYRNIPTAQFGEISTDKVNKLGGILTNFEDQNQTENLHSKQVILIHESPIDVDDENQKNIFVLPIPTKLVESQNLSQPNTNFEISEDASQNVSPENHPKIKYSLNTLISPEVVGKLRQDLQKHIKEEINNQTEIFEAHSVQMETNAKTVKENPSHSFSTISTSVEPEIIKQIRKDTDESQIPNDIQKHVDSLQSVIRPKVIIQSSVHKSKNSKPEEIKTQRLYIKLPIIPVEGENSFKSETPEKEIDFQNHLESIKSVLRPHDVPEESQPAGNIIEEDNRDNLPILPINERDSSSNAQEETTQKNNDSFNQKEHEEDLSFQNRMPSLQTLSINHNSKEQPKIVANEEKPNIYVNGKVKQKRLRVKLPIIPVEKVIQNEGDNLHQKKTDIQDIFQTHLDSLKSVIHPRITRHFESNTLKYDQ